MSEPQIDFLTPILDKHESQWAGTLAALRSHLKNVARMSGMPVSSDHAHAYLDTHGICVAGDRRWLGALFRDGQWLSAGYAPSKRVAKNHGRKIEHWLPRP